MSIRNDLSNIEKNFWKISLEDMPKEESTSSSSEDDWLTEFSEKQINHVGRIHEEILSSMEPVRQIGTLSHRESAIFQTQMEKLKKQLSSQSSDQELYFNQSPKKPYKHFIKPVIVNKERKLYAVFKKHAPRKEEAAGKDRPIACGIQTIIWPGYELETNQKIIIARPLYFKENARSVNQDFARAYGFFKQVYPKTCLSFVEYQGKHGPRCLYAQTFFPFTLAHYLKKNTLPLPEKIQLMVQLANGLILLKSLHIIHNDIKPENIYLDKDTYIGDFGLSRYDEEEISDLFFCGTPIYQAPEKFKDIRPSYAADLWSLGLIYVEILSAFADAMRSLPENWLDKYLPSTEKPLHLLISRMLQPKLANRITAEQVSAELSAFL